MHPLRSLSLSLALALGTALVAPAQAQSLVELLNAARGYDAPWQSAKAQLDAAVARADQARAGLLPARRCRAGFREPTARSALPQCPTCRPA